MLTIDEIREISFRRAGKNGYNAADVDEFIDEVTATVEQLIDEKNDTVRKMEILAGKIEQYREDEETVRNALITSQKLNDSTLREAQNKAEYIIKTAEKKRQAILTEAEMATEREKDKFEAIHADVAELRREILELYKKHITIVQELPTDEDVRKRREELDEKYPFEPIEENVTEYIPEEAESQQEMVEAPAREVTAEPEAAPARPELKRERHDKFEKLQFGENYDV